MSRAEALASALREALGDKIRETIVALGEVTIVVGGADHLAVARVLRDDARLDFAQLIDLAGIDYSSFGETGSRRTALRGRHASAVTAPQLARART